MATFHYENLSFENRSLIYQLICCTKFNTLNKILDNFLINFYGANQANQKDQEKLLFKVWIQEINRESGLKNIATSESLFLDELIAKASQKYSVFVDLNHIDYRKINSPRQDYYDSMQSSAYKRLAFLSKIISASQHFTYSYSESDHASDSARIAQKIAKTFNLSSHSLYHLKSIVIDHSFGESALGKSGGNSFKQILQKHGIPKEHFQFSHNHNVMRHLIAENASFSRINSAANLILRSIDEVDENKLLRQYPREIQNLFKKLSRVQIFNGVKVSYLNNLPNFETQIITWSDGISWITNDLKLLLKLDLCEAIDIAKKIDFIKDIYFETLQEIDSEDKNFIDIFVENVRNFLVTNYINAIKSSLEKNDIYEDFSGFAEDIRYSKYLIGANLSLEINSQVQDLIEILSNNLYQNFLYTVGNPQEKCAKQDMWLRLLTFVSEKILYFYQNNIALPDFYQNLLKKNINYVFDISYRSEFSNEQNIIIAIVKFLGLELTDREILGLCDLILRNYDTNLKEYFTHYKDSLKDIYDLDDLIAEF